ncbi:MAG: Asp-tRNA(Asn)/Glu-tRNA(Gln) amidotransferase subunit GatB [Patescibacteria group bacterium]
MPYKPTIGLEIHIELNTKTKMFCGSLNNPEERRPNVNVCPVCMGHPGTLPVINEEAVKKTIKTGLALNCQIPEYSKFDRKNYFYPDLPKGYQISQYDMPLCKEGYLEITGRKIRITRVHLEEDTGRLIHPEGAGYSLVDFNRAGIPLMELVTEPDIGSGQEAKDFAEELHRILHYLEVSDADMEKGEMRVEVNISLSKNEKLGTKVEIKNLNSFRSVERGIDFETKRQAELLEKGEKIIQETRGWDDVKGITYSQREKEEAHDYRYFPEPDLPPLHFVPEYITKIRAEVSELPQQKRARFKREFELDEKTIEIFVQNKHLGEYFEKVISEFGPNLSHEKIMDLIKLASNYLISDLLGLLKGEPISGNFPITPENFAQFIGLICDEKISSKLAKQILPEMFTTGADPNHIIEEKGLEQITDKLEIENIIREIIAKNPKVVEDYKRGKENSVQFLIGQIMAQTNGKANPQIARGTLLEELTKLK